MDIIHGGWNRGSKRRNREYRNSFVKKNPHKKKEEMETRAPVRKGRWKQQSLGKKKTHKNRQQVMLVAITSG